MVMSTVFIGKEDIWSNYDRLLNTNTAMKIAMIGKDTTAIKHDISFLDTIYKGSDFVVIANYLYRSDSHKNGLYICNCDLNSQDWFKIPQEYIHKTITVADMMLDNMQVVRVHLTGMSMDATSIALSMEEDAKIAEYINSVHTDRVLRNLERSHGIASIVALHIPYLFDVSKVKDFSKILVDLPEVEGLIKNAFSTEDKAYATFANLMNRVELFKASKDSASLKTPSIIDSYIAYTYTKFRCKIYIDKYYDILKSIITDFEDKVLCKKLTAKYPTVGLYTGYTDDNVFYINADSYEEETHIIEQLSNFDIRHIEIHRALKYKDKEENKTFLFSLANMIALGRA